MKRTTATSARPMSSTRLLLPPPYTVAASLRPCTMNAPTTGP